MGSFAGGHNTPCHAQKSPPNRDPGRMDPGEGKFKRNCFKNICL